VLEDDDDDSLLPAVSLVSLLFDDLLLRPFTLLERLSVT